MKQFRHLRIRTWVLFFLLSLTAINFFSVAGYIFFNNVQSDQLTDVASKNNELAVALVEHDYRLQMGEAEAAASLRSLITEYEAGLHFLKEEEGQQEIFLDKSLSLEREKLIRRTELEWQTYKLLIQSRIDKLSRAGLISEGAKQEALPSAFLLLNSALVKAFNDDSVDGTWFHSILIVSSALSFLVLLASYLVLHRLLFEPLKEIGAKAKQMAAGDYEQSIRYAYQNELAEFTAALNGLFSKFRNTAYIVKELGKGNLNFRVEDVCTTENFEQDIFVKSLLETRDTLKKNEEENEQRSWATAGVAKLEDILRQHNKDLKQLSDAVLVFLVKYLNANQGAVFLRKEDEQQEGVLEMTGCYAYGRKKFVNKTVQAGEGLVGQILLEKEMLYLTDLPQNYISISSGLGEARPSALLVFPLKVEEQVVGVIELASFKNFEPYQQEFIAQAAQSIASSVMNARVNIKTSRLLEMSQQQTEELRAQEEEMRQNMEEMEATQEEMQRIRHELEEQKEKLSAAMSIAQMANWEIDLQANEFHLNDNFFALLGTSAAQEGGYQLQLSQIVKQYFYPEADKVQAAIEKVIVLADPQHEEQLLHKAVNRGGTEIYLSVVLKALLNDKGQVGGLYGVCRDVSREYRLEQERDTQLEAMHRTRLELEEQKEKLSTAMSIAHMANWEIDLQTNGFLLNDNFYALLGTSAAQEGGYEVKVEQIVKQYFYPEADKVQATIERVIATADPLHEEKLLHKAVNRAGEEIYLSVVLKALLNNKGQVSGLYGICYDVTHEHLQK